MRPRRVIFDQSVPRRLRDLLTGFHIATAYEAGWATKSNGDLLATAERAGFDVFVTADQNLPFQQQIAGRHLAIVSLDTNHWQAIRAAPERVQEACEQATAGSYAVVTFPRLARRKRAPRPHQP